MNPFLEKFKDRLSNEWKSLGSLKFNSSDGYFGYEDLVRDGIAEEKRERIWKGNILCGETIFIQLKSGVKM